MPASSSSPARRILTGRRRVITGSIPCGKGGGSVPFEGLREARMVEVTPVFAFDGVARPVRRVWKRNHRSGFRGRLFCEKGGGRVEAESLGEFDLARLMVDDDAVVAFRHQPETFRWREDGGRRRKYTPDFVLLLQDGTRVYREVKRAGDYLLDPDLEGRLEAIVLQCRSRRAAFELWTEAASDVRGSRAMVRRIHRS